MTLEKCLSDLRDQSKPLRHSSLLQLSALSSDDVVEFDASWSSLSPGRKGDTLGRLVELSEENLELDFIAVFLACLRDEDEEVRERATRGLWECDDRTVISPLIALLKDDPSPKVKSAAAMSLGKFADMAREGKLLPRDAERIQGVLLSALREDGQDLEVKRRAIEAVASFNTSEIAQTIREAYESGHPKLRQSAIYAMGRSSDAQWLPTVLKEARHEDPGIRYEAAGACGQLGDESTVPHLVELTKDDDAEVQLSAVQALGAIGGPVARRALLQCLQMEDEDLNDGARAALDNIEFDLDPLGVRFES